MSLVIEVTSYKICILNTEMLQLAKSQMMRNYCMILITNHSLFKNDISRNQDQFANDSPAVERTKFIACIT